MHSSTIWRTVSTSSSPTLNTVPDDRSGCSIPQYHGGGAVLGVAVVVEGEALVGHDDPPPSIEDAPNDRPFPGDGLVGPVEIRVAEVGGPRMGIEHRRFASATMR